MQPAMNPEGLSEANLFMLFNECKKHVKLFHEIAPLSSCSFYMNKFWF